MSIKTERQAFQWKAFLGVYLMIAFTLTVIYLLIEYLDNDEPAFYQRAYWIVIYPLLFTSTMLNNFRRATLIISEFNEVTQFYDKLNRRIDQFRLKELSSSENTRVLTPASWFKALFNNWFSSEVMEITTLDDKVIITAPAYRISQLEDTLTWNKDFKS